MKTRVLVDNLSSLDMEKEIVVAMRTEDGKYIFMPVKSISVNKRVEIDCEWKDKK